ncbi:MULTISPECIES: extracellular catalytic domain type 1 short-chain-length polyhydroxyalkanoate depolymerase [Alphaproteobacteria]|uniref:LpqC, poly n=2 Tax=Alphaproteobacteria TaxID=28211 RepID=A0A512HGP1_9HYPH|nr:MULTISPECIES: PHB depolymerase family esterase [Alphaproteobacteria]GEO84623.1 LpqC, poly [Ciceribacter naphthalenivorans]GLR22586.1 LpqC, poly [Ciceribacter naphthalenivorans]GLT05442.1 LpqC, poly [Sphingomonas psychrolutea]
MRLKIPMPWSFVLGQQKKLQKKLLKTVPSLPLVEPAKPRNVRVLRPRLREVEGFGTNPGHLRMLEYVPPKARVGAPLVVVLHGCLQTAGDFDKGSGWSTLAREHGFVLLYPEQRKSNNPNLCFNWFRPSAVARDRGELMSVRQMIENACVRHRVDRKRIYVQGLSAGGGMASALLATYPELFAAGQIVAGVPFGAARDAMSALSVMKSGVNRTPREWGDLVRAVTPEIKKRPLVSIWHGTADQVVSVVNARATLLQWLDLYGLDEAAGTSKTIKGHTVMTWYDAKGRALVEFCLIDGLAHGLPIAARRTAAMTSSMPFMLEGGLSAPAHMVRTFMALR